MEEMNTYIEEQTKELYHIQHLHDNPKLILQDDNLKHIKRNSQYRQFLLSKLIEYFAEHIHDEIKIEVFNHFITFKYKKYDLYTLDFNADQITHHKNSHEAYDMNSSEKVIKELTEKINKLKYASSSRTNLYKYNRQLGLNKFFSLLATTKAHMDSLKCEQNELEEHMKFEKEWAINKSKDNYDLAISKNKIEQYQNEIEVMMSETTQQIPQRHKHTPTNHLKTKNRLVHRLW